MWSIVGASPLGPSSNLTAGVPLLPYDAVRIDPHRLTCILPPGRLIWILSRHLASLPDPPLLRSRPATILPSIAACSSGFIAFFDLLIAPP
jgi:hypothetical protein